jgi:hypothetical protein
LNSISENFLRVLYCHKRIVFSVWSIISRFRMCTTHMHDRYCKLNSHPSAAVSPALTKSAEPNLKCPHQVALSTSSASWFLNLKFSFMDSVRPFWSLWAKCSIEEEIVQHSHNPMKHSKRLLARNGQTWRRGLDMH